MRCVCWLFVNVMMLVIKSDIMIKNDVDSGVINV